MPKPTIPIIDTHQHLWDLKALKLPWLDNAGPPLATRHWTEEYNADTEGLPIKTTMYMEVDVAPNQKVEEAELILKLIESNSSKTTCAIISADPGQDGFRAFVDRYRDNDAIKGFRQVLHIEQRPPKYCLTKKFIENCQYLAEIDKTYDLCMRAMELADVAKLANECPQTRFIVDHCGNADPKAFLPEKDPRRGKPTHDAQQWKRDMKAIAENQNVYCKISGIIARVPEKWSPADLKPIVDHCAEAFGSRRILFGSDWPVCDLGASLKEWIEALAEITADWPMMSQERLWQYNAKTVYKI